MRTPTAGGAGGKSDNSSATAASSERLPGWRRAVAWLRSNTLIREIVAAFLTALISFGPIAGAPRVKSFKDRADD